MSRRSWFAQTHLGHRRDTRGRPLGRIEDVRAERRHGEWIVRDYVLGAAGLLE